MYFLTRNCLQTRKKKERKKEIHSRRRRGKICHTQLLTREFASLFSERLSVWQCFAVISSYHEERTSFTFLSLLSWLSWLSVRMERRMQAMQCTMPSSQRLLYSSLVTFELVFFLWKVLIFRKEKEKKRFLQQGCWSVLKCEHSSGGRSWNCN